MEKTSLLYSFWILTPLDKSSTAGIWGGEVRDGRCSLHSFPSLVFWIWDGGGGGDAFQPKPSTPQNLQIPESFDGADEAHRRAPDFAVGIVFQPRYGESKIRPTRLGKSQLLCSALSTLLCDPRCSRSNLSSSFPLVFHCSFAGVFWLCMLLAVDLFFLNPNLNFHSLLKSNNYESGIACCFKISFAKRFEFVICCSVFDYLNPELLTPSFMRNVLMTLWCEVNLDIWIPWHFLCSFVHVFILVWNNKVNKYFLTGEQVLDNGYKGFFLKWFELLNMNYKHQNLLNNQLLISGVGFHANTPGKCYPLETIRSMTTYPMYNFDWKLTSMPLCVIAENLRYSLLKAMTNEMVFKTITCLYSMTDVALYPSLNSYLVNFDHNQLNFLFCFQVFLCYLILLTMNSDNEDCQQPAYKPIWSLNSTKNHFMNHTVQEMSILRIPLQSTTTAQMKTNIKGNCC